MTEAELRYLVRVQDQQLKQLQRDIRATNKALGQDTSTASKKASVNLQKIGAAAGKAGLILAGGLVVAGVKATKAAVDLGEQVNKTRVVFGQSGNDVVAWSKTLASRFGISQRAALEFAGVFGNMLVPMGFARGEASRVSKQLVELSADMASFNNASPEEVLEALRSGLSGETEPLRRFGVFLGAARVKAEAMSLGLVKATRDTDKIRAAQLRAQVAQSAYNKAVAKSGPASLEAKRAKATLISAESALAKAVKGTIPELTAEQKAKATLALITKDTKDAQGDFARTSGSLANQQRILRARFENVSAQLGKSLIPLGTKLAGLFNSLIGLASRNTGVVKVLAVALGVLAVGLIALSVAVKVYTFATNEATRSTLKLMLALVTNPVFLVIAALVALGLALVIAYKKSETFRRIVHAAFDAVKRAAQAFASFFTTTVPNAFRRVLAWVRSNWPKIAVFIAGPFAPLVALATNAFGVRSALTGALSRLLTAAKDKARAIGRGIKDAIIGGVRGLAGALWAVVKAAINTVISGWNALGIPSFKIHIPIPGAPDINFSTPSISLPNIPYLARGAVIDRPTLALLGETQRARPEIVTPERLMRRIVRQELSRLASVGGPLVHIERLEVRDDHDVTLVAGRLYRRLAQGF